MDFYKEVIEEAPFGYIAYREIYDIEGNTVDFEVIEANKTLKKIIDFKENNINKRKIKDVIPNIKNEDYELLKNYGNLAVEGKNQEFDVHSERLKRWFKLKFFFMGENKFYIIVKDITKEKEFEERYKIMLETSREVVIIIQNEKLVFFNHMLGKITGYSNEDLMNMKIDDFIFRDDFNQAMSNYQKRISANHIIPYQFRIISKNKDVKWMEISSTEMNWNEKDAVLFFLTDVTQRREYEDALFESERRKTSLIKSMDDIIFILDSNFMFKEFYVPESQELYMNPDTFLGKRFEEIGFPKPAYDILLETLEQTKKTQKSGQAEYYLESPQGTTWFDARITMVEGYEHGEKELLCVIRNITKLKESEKEIRRERDLFSEGPVMTIVWGSSKKLPIKRVSRNIEDILGYSVEDFTDKNFDYSDIIYPEDLENSVLSAEQCIVECKNTFEQSYRLKNQAGEYRWFYDFTRVIRNNEGNVTEIRAYLFDQSQIKEIERQLHKERERLNNIVEGTNAGTWEWNVQTHKVVFNEKTFEILGYSAKELVIETIEDWEKVSHPDDFKKRKKNLQRHFAGESGYFESEYRVKDSNGEWKWILSRGKVLSWTKDGEPLTMFGIHLDIDKRKRAEKKVLELSIRDPLTNIYNRRYIFERIREIKEKYRRTKEEFSVAVVDIDHFKKINDKYGHMTGDFVLKEFTKLISHKIRPFDLLGRYGGEEFIIVMTNCTKEIANKRIEAILDEVRNKEFKHKDIFIKITFSAGIVDSEEFKGNEINLDSLIDIADKRLYLAKQLGRDRIEIIND